MGLLRLWQSMSEFGKCGGFQVERRGAGRRSRSALMELLISAIKRVDMLMLIIADSYFDPIRYSAIVG